MRTCMQLDHLQLAQWFRQRALDIPVVNVGNPNECTIKQLAAKVLDLIPASTSQLVYKELPQDAPRQRRPDIGVARELLNWGPVVPLEQGLRRTSDCFRQFV